NRYSKYHPGLAIAEIPFYVVLYAATSEMRGMAEKHREQMLRAWVPSLTNTTLTALLVIFFFQTLITMGYGDKVALGTTLLLTFTTPIWPYARYDFSEPLQTLLLFLTFALTITTKQNVHRARSEW